jgi:hypothetical protein
MNSPDIDPEGMRRRLDAALEKELLGQPLTEVEARIVQYVRYASRAARPVDPRIQVRVNQPDEGSSRETQDGEGTDGR